MGLKKFKRDRQESTAFLRALKKRCGVELRHGSDAEWFRAFTGMSLHGIGFRAWVISLLTGSPSVPLLARYNEAYKELVAPKVEALAKRNAANPAAGLCKRMPRRKKPKPEEKARSTVSVPRIAVAGPFTFNQLGFVTYHAYLRSPLWRRIRLQVLARDKNLCVACNNNAEHVHHRDYELATMKGDQLSSLISLCEECHRSIESGKPKDRTIIEDRLVMLLRANGKERCA